MLVWRLVLLAATACALAVERNDEHVDEAQPIDNFSEIERMTGDEDLYIDEEHLIDNSTEVERMENAMERSSSWCPIWLHVKPNGMLNVKTYHPRIFGREYVKQPTLDNGRPWYIGEEPGDKIVLRFYLGQWVLQDWGSRTHRVYARARVTPTCPTAIGKNWEYLSPVPGRPSLPHRWTHAHSGLEVVADLKLYTHFNAWRNKEGWSYCTKNKPCQEGLGDCDNDQECWGSLKCGRDNCRAYPHAAKWNRKLDCCFDPTPKTRPCAPRGDHYWQKKGNDECCNEGGNGKCKLGEGDCDKDSDCEGSLVCGKDNCPWGDKDDCCMKR